MTDLLSCLQAWVDRAVERLHAHPQASRVLDGTAPADTLARYYATAYDTVREAPNLLRRSHDTLKRKGGHPELIALLGSKVEEERGHDRWLADDLAAIGYPHGPGSWPRAAPAAALYNSFHQHITGLRGEAFLGTAWVLESLSLRCAGVAADNLRARGSIAGIANGVSFLASHHDADVGHVAQLAAAIERCVIEPSAQDYVRLCAAFTASVYPDFFAAR
jgi:Iron-containing redox enzyme